MSVLNFVFRRRVYQSSASLTFVRESTDDRWQFSKMQSERVYNTPKENYSTQYLEWKIYFGVKPYERYNKGNIWTMYKDNNKN